MQQLNIFDSPFIGYNRAIKALLNLDPSRAGKLLKTWQKRFPGRKDLTLEFQLIDFLTRKATRTALMQEPVSAFELWQEKWDPLLRKDSKNRELLGLFRDAYFKKVSQVLLQLDRTRQLHDSPVHLLCLLRAKHYPEVLRIGRRHLEDGNMPGRVLGYMADALWETREKSRALATYLRALIEGPGEIDSVNICNGDVRRLLASPEEVIEDSLGKSVEFKEGERAAWAAASGLLTGIFESPRLEEPQCLFTLYQRFDHLQQQDDNWARGTTFALAIILSEQGMKTLSSLEIDIASVRSVMKEIHPLLFSIYMEFIRYRPLLSHQAGKP